MLTLFTLVAVAALGVVGFVLWATVRSVDWVVRLVRGPAVHVAAAPVAVPPVARCPQAGCQTANPPPARFCRRCGSPMHAGQSFQHRPSPFNAPRPVQTDAGRRVADLA